jgi:hypothetical protein
VCRLLELNNMKILEAPYEKIIINFRIFLIATEKIKQKPEHESGIVYSHKHSPRLEDQDLKPFKKPT